MNADSKITRRVALKWLGLGASALYLPGCAHRMPLLGREASAPNLDYSPINRTRRVGDGEEFSGDEMSRAHSILWKKDEWLASQRPGDLEPTERVPLVVIGGGISGLTSAYLLREHQPIILEQASRFGGNAQGESWEGIDYSIGAAYFVEADPGSKLEALYRELGVGDFKRVTEETDPFLLDHRIQHDFWSAAVSPHGKAQFKRLHKYLSDLWNGENGQIYPGIPAEKRKDRLLVNALDRVSLKSHLEAKLGGKLDPILLSAIDSYCWSSFSGSSSEISAASGLNFYAGELGTVIAPPGGNSAVAERLVQKLSSHLPAKNLRAGSLVVDVREVSDGVRIVYQTPDLKTHSIHAKTVVMACPKFVVKKLLQGIEPNRVEAISKMEYRSYLVCNLLLKRQPTLNFYDLFLVDQKDGPTDVILANYSQPSSNRAGQPSVLTFYRPMPVAQGRGQLYEEGSYKRFRAEFEKQIEGEVLGQLGLHSQDIVDYRLTRWGHPIPLAATGLIANGTVDEIRKPFGNRICFAEQDNWALPSIETCFSEAMTAARWVQARIG